MTNLFKWMATIILAIVASVATVRIAALLILAIKGYNDMPKLLGTLVGTAIVGGGAAYAIRYIWGRKRS